MILKSILLIIISFLYTFLYMFILDVDLLIFPLLSKRSGNGGVRSDEIRNLQIFLFIILTIIMILLVIFLFKKIRGYFLCIYISSLLSAFLMPLFFSSLNSGSFISFQWYFTGIKFFLGNLIMGPAMFFLIDYFFLKKLIIKD